MDGSLSRRPFPGSPVRWLVPAALGVLLLAQSGAFRRANGVTYDETFFLSAGLAVYLDGDFGLFHGEQVAPLPVLVEYWAAARRPEARSRHQATLDSRAEEPLWQGRLQDPALVDAARLAATLLVGIPILALVYAWLWRRRGPLAATLGASLLALSPTMVAHASLATTDACFALFSLLALAALAAYASRPGRITLGAVAGASGLALASKLSAVFLVPVTVLVLGEAAWREQRTSGGAGWLRRAILRGAWAAAVALLVLWACYGFAWAAPDPDLAAALERGGALRLFGRWALVPRPAPVAAFQVLMKEAGSLQQYLMGETSREGWWTYFPVAFLLKSTPAELLLVVAGLLAGGLTWKRPWTPTVADAGALWSAAFATYATMAALAAFDIGQRHILLLYPLAILLAVDRLALFLTGRPRALAVAAVALVALQASSAWRISPAYLSYFNGLAGGPEGGHRYLLDSNLDWGQDLPQLAPALVRSGCSTTYLVYFGTARPEAYGLAEADGASAEPECLAISVTPLYGVGVPSDDWRSFRGREPVGRAGYSILVYALADPAARAAWRQAAGASGTAPRLTLEGLYRIDAGRSSRAP
jgi:hypothetical protein